MENKETILSWIFIWNLKKLMCKSKKPRISSNQNHYIVIVFSCQLVKKTVFNVPNPSKFHWLQLDVWLFQPRQSSWRRGIRSSCFWNNISFLNLFQEWPSERQQIGVGVVCSVGPNCVVVCSTPKVRCLRMWICIAKKTPCLFRSD